MAPNNGVTERQQHRLQHPDFNFTLCDPKTGKEHSGASRACTLLALLRLDVHSLIRQPSSLVKSLCRAHLLPVNGRRRAARGWPNDKLRLAIFAMSIVQNPSERCRPVRRLLEPKIQMLQKPKRGLASLSSSLAAHSPPMPSSNSMPSSTTSSTTSFWDPLPPPPPPAAFCGPQSSFDIRLLPYRWLPGLDTPDRAGATTSGGRNGERSGIRGILPLDEASHAKRFEVRSFSWLLRAGCVSVLGRVE